MKVLFVCLGNICRSPAAEGIFRHKVKQAGIDHLITCDSAGTSAYHEGDPADGRMREHARDRGYDLTSRARHLEPEDLEHFDLILTMDESNYNNTLRLDPEGTYHGKVKKMVSYCKVHDVGEVPDPYYGGADGFELVIDILEDSCDQLIKELEDRVR